MTTLLETAKQVKLSERSNSPYGQEEAELAVAWLRGEIRGIQVSKALDVKTSSRGSVYCFLACALKAAYQKGLIR